MKRNKNTYKKCFVQQQSTSDCGIACLQSILKFYSSKNYSREHLRVWSGTTQTGASMAGLIACCKKIGLAAEGFKATMTSLKEQTEPTILHVILEDGRLHFIICYEWDNSSKKFLVTDPSTGLFSLSEDELSEIWSDGLLLTLTPNEHFSPKKADKNKWFTLCNFLKHEPNAIIIGVFFGIIMAFLGIMISVFVQRLVDTLLPNKLWDKTMETLIFLFTALLLRLVLGTLRGRLLSFFQESFSNGITTHFYSKLLNLPISFFSHRKTGEMVSRLHDISRIQRGVSSILGSLTVDFVMIAVSITYLLILSDIIVGVVIVSLFIYLISGMAFNKGLKNHNTGVMHAYAQTENMFISSFSGIRDIQSNMRESMFIQKGENLYQKYQEKILSFTKFQLNISFWVGLVGLVTQIICIYLGIELVKNEKLTAGEVIAIITITLNVQQPMIKLSLVNIQVSEIKVAFNRIYEIVNLTFRGKKEKEFNQTMETIELKNLAFSYPGAPLLFEELSLTIIPNTLTTFIGPSGSGKSSILNLLKKEIEPTRGEITINGSQNLLNASSQSWLSRLGVVNQETMLFNGTLIENIAFAFDMSMEEKSEVIEFSQKMGFHTYFMTLPMNYLTVIEENGSNLSGGQKQLIALARALYTKPELLILDEPTSSLDDDTEKFVISLLKQMKEQMTIIAVSHRKEILKITDQVITIGKGIVI